MTTGLGVPSEDRPVQSIPAADRFLGLDIGGTKTQGVIVDSAGRVLVSRQSPTAQGTSGVTRTAIAVAEELLASSSAPVASTLGVGIPGIVDPERGAVMHAVNLGVSAEWHPLAHLLSERLGMKVVLENDVNAATVGAAALTQEPDLAYLSIGTGLAAGLMLDGRLRRGFLGAAGEIGHIPLVPAGIKCACGQAGCLETIASGSALAKVLGDGQFPPAQGLFADSVAEGATAEIRSDFAEAIGAAIRVIALAVDPRRIVIGGGVAQLGQPLKAAIVDALVRQARTSPFLASLSLASRIELIPDNYPVAAAGAAMLVQ